MIQPSAAMQTDALSVALLIGFDLVGKYAQLPAGFRMNFEDAHAAGAFKDCLTLGQMEKAYCNFICRNVE